MSFRENIVHLRAVNNMTQEQLAMLLGVSRQSVAKWEAGKTSPEMEKLLGMCQIFNCTLDELVQGDLTGRMASEALAQSTYKKPEDVFGYDEQMRTFASKISNGVMAIIMGVACGLVCGAIGDTTGAFNHDVWNGVISSLLTVFILGGVGIGLALIIPAGLNHSAFVKAHPYLMDFYTPEEKANAQKVFYRELIGGISCIFVGICSIPFLDAISHNDYTPEILFMFLLAIGVRFIIHGGMTLGRVNLDEYNRTAGELMDEADIENSDLLPEQKSQLIAVHRSEKRVGAICGTIMLLATIAGLAMLFIPAVQNDYFWLAWVFGGLLCAVSSVLIKGLFEESSKS